MGYAITTRYVGPTNYRGSRIIATGPGLTHDGPKTRATVSWNYEIGSGEDQYRPAAEAIADQLRAAGWHVTVGAGATLPDDGYVFILDYDARS